jgi:hypothetical protein
MLLKDSIRDHLMAIIGEFVETFLFLFFAFAGTQTISLELVTLNKIREIPARDCFPVSFIVEAGCKELCIYAV